MAKLYVGTADGMKRVSIASEESVSTLTSNFNSFKSSTNSSISNINTKITSLQNNSGNFKTITGSTVNIAGTSDSKTVTITNSALVGKQFIIVALKQSFTNSYGTNAKYATSALIIDTGYNESYHGIPNSGVGSAVVQYDSTSGTVTIIMSCSISYSITVTPTVYYK